MLEENFLLILKIQKICISFSNFCGISTKYWWDIGILKFHVCQKNQNFAIFIAPIFKCTKNYIFYLNLIN
jgi:hypothetical protein